MASMNSVQLIGNITRDPKLEYIGENKTAVATTGIALNRRWKSRTGETQEETCFVELKAWGRTAEILNQYVEKGRQVGINGRLTFEEWQDKESGQRRTKLSVTIENLHLIGSRTDNNDRAEQQDDNYAGPDL